MNSVSIAIVDANGGNLSIQGGLMPSSAVMTTGAHGPESLRLTYPTSAVNAWRMIDKPGVYKVLVGAAGRVWGGRVEDIVATPDGIEMTALGHWRAFYDNQWTDFFSTANYDNWKWSPSVAAEYGNDQKGRLASWLRKDNKYPQYAQAQYNLWLPSGVVDRFARLRFSYQINLPVGFSVYAVMLNSSGSYLPGTWLLPATGSPQSGSVDTAIASSGGVALALFCRYDSAGAYTNTADDATYYCEFNGVRLTSLSSGLVNVKSVAERALAVAVNSGALLTGAEAIAGNSLDIDELIVEDELPADVLTALAAYGDGTSNTRYEIGVDADQRVYYRAATVGRTWQVAASDITIERTIEQVVNKFYGVYDSTDGSNRKLRTATAQDARSIAEYGMIRTRALPVKSTTLSVAEKYRDVALADRKDLRPRISFVVENLMCQSNAIASGWEIKAGDNIVINGLPITANLLPDSRLLRVARTEYDLVSGALRIEPESVPPELDAMIARNELRARRDGAA